MAKKKRKQLSKKQKKATARNYSKRSIMGCISMLTSMVNRPEKHNVFAKERYAMSKAARLLKDITDNWKPVRK